MPLITLLSAKADWWGNLNAKQRQSYLGKHPNSRYGARGQVPPVEHKRVILKKAKRKPLQGR